MRRIVLAALLSVFHSLAVLAAGKEPIDAWNVDDLKPGMTGYGLTVMKGTATERFQVTIISVVKNASPGRDMVICRVDGLGLEKSGVIAGMSGSPVYVEEKLVGAVAFTWSFGKDPIGGITPFRQMAEYSRPPGSRSPGGAEVSYLLDQPLSVVRSTLEPIEASAEAAGVSGDGMLVPVRTPVSASGFSAAALHELSRHLSPFGMFPVQAAGGASPGKNGADKAARTKIVPGGAMAVGLATGDVSLTAVGTVTTVVGNRVYGFGHPFLSSGKCQLPLLGAHIHTVIPRQSLSFKMGTALDAVGVIDADASTCVAGNLGEAPDLLPMKVSIVSNVSNLPSRKFNCQVVREASLVGPIALSVLASCADLDGQAPFELTTKVKAKIEIDDQPPLVIEDVFSGAPFSGPQGLSRTFLPIGNLLFVLANNPFHRPRIKSIECAAEIVDARKSAKLMRARIEQPTVEAGETLRIVARLQPYQPGRKAEGAGEVVDVPLEIPLPKDLEPGRYLINVGDASSDLRAELLNRPHLLSPVDFGGVYRLLALQTAMKRTELIARFDSPRVGVALDGEELPNLPGGFAAVLIDENPQQTTPLRSSVVARKTTPWAVEGSTSVPFEVVKEKRFYVP